MSNIKDEFIRTVNHFEKGLTIFKHQLKEQVENFKRQLKERVEKSERDNLSVVSNKIEGFLTSPEMIDILEYFINFSQMNIGVLRELIEEMPDTVEKIRLH